MKKIITFIFALVLSVALFACDSCNGNIEEKNNPRISNPNNILVSLKETINNVTYTYDVTNGQMYLSLKKDVGSSVLMNLVDKFLLQEYYNKVTDEQIKEKIDKDVYGEDEDLTNEEKEEKENEFLDTMFVSYGCVENSIYGESIKEHYRLSLAEKAYALEILQKEYNEHMDKYNAYNALTDEEKEEKQKEAEENKETLITTPYYSDSSFANKYNSDLYTKYNVIIIPFKSARQANIALQACGIYINEAGLWASSNGVSLSAYEVVEKHIELYEYLYGVNGLNLDSEEFILKESEVNAISSNITARIKDKLGFYTQTSSNVDPDWYYPTPFITSGGSVYAYVLNLGVEKVTVFNDLSDEEKEEVRMKYLSDLFESSLTNDYILLQTAKLREEKNLKIYDTVIELSYMKAIASNTDVTYERVKEEKASIVCSVDGKEFSADELFVSMLKDYGLSGAGDELVEKRFLVNPNFNPYYVVSTKTWVDKDKHQDIKDIVAEEKKNFNNGVYTSDGYDKKTCTWQTFIETVYGVDNEADLEVHFLMDLITVEYKEKINYIAHYTGDKVENYVLTMSLEDAEKSSLWANIQSKMQEEVDNYFSVKGIHLLICVYEASSTNPVDPVDWTETQNLEAVNLYNEIVEYLKDTKGTYQEKFEKIVQAFKDAPYKDGDFEFNGDPVMTTLKGDTTSVINVSFYKGLGLNVKFEDLGTFTNGQMVTEFNDAVKAIWDKDIKDSATARTTLASDVIKTQFGYHVYVNLDSNTLSYIEVTTEKTAKLDEDGNPVLDDNDEVIMVDVDVTRYLPTLEEIRLYTLNPSSSSLKSSTKTAITKYYTPYAKELTGDNYTYALRFYQMKQISSTFSMEGYFNANDFSRYCELYIEFTMDQYISKVTEDFFE